VYPQALLAIGITTADTTSFISKANSQPFLAFDLPALWNQPALAA
jgi:hypothetical protein